MYHKTLSYRIFTMFNNALLIIISILCLLPLFHLLMVSLSSNAPANAGLVTFCPIGFTLETVTLMVAVFFFYTSYFHVTPMRLIRNCLSLLRHLTHIHIQQIPAMTIQISESGAVHPTLIMGLTVDSAASLYCFL
ncbi:ABC-type glycerol-3-phosphate transport system permease component [Paenibacillus sp. V4I5]|nr:ABC-type glycerol-3-phosphate transport system permease component [Paenibacillus sp. V4I5]